MPLLIFEKLYQLRRVVNSIRSSGQRRERFENICINESKIDHLELIIDCPTRWNSSCDMIERALKMKPVSYIIIFKC